MDESVERIRELYLAALEHAPAERSRFLDEACGGDAMLRERVASLLAARGEASGLFERPPWELFLDSGSGSENGSHDLEIEPGLPFQCLGEFRLIRKLGEGGMGVVYLAVQESMKRLVALKVIRPERAGSFEAEKRFWRELEAVSSLRHPNIVTVYGSGEEKGTRYFAMELVPGRDLDEILEEAKAAGERIPTQRALGWIREIARALASAHRAGIIHRDVKPSNIRIDDAGGAKLMDFGVARHVQLSTMTLTGAFRGTPRYAAPEQIEAKRDVLDERIDVYALGVTLYETVIGRPPFEGESTAQVFRRILTQEPVPPRRLNPALSRDVETVILTAMEKDPNRRYGTMAQFADDLDRLLKGEMIRARPAGPVTRAWKRVRRNPLLSAAVGVALLAVFALLLSIPWYIVRIRNERDAAEKEAKKAGVINEFLRNIFLSADPVVKGKDVKVVDVLEEAVHKIDGAFPDQPEVEASLRDSMGRTYYGLGFYKEAEAQHAAALEIRRRCLGEEHRDTLTSMSNLGRTMRKLGRFSEAESLYRRTLALRRRTLGAEHEDTLVSMNNLANLLLSRGAIGEAETLYRKILEVRRRHLGERHPDTLMSMNNLACVYMQRMKYAEAEPVFRAVLDAYRALGPERPDTLTTMCNLAYVLGRQGKMEEAESLVRQALEIQRRTLGEAHSDTLTTMNKLAYLLWKQERFEEAEALVREAMECQRRALGEEHRDTLLSMNHLAHLYQSRGAFAQAESLLRRVVEVQRRVLGANHADTRASLSALAGVLEDQGRFSEAEPLLLEVFHGMKPAGGAEDPQLLEIMDRLIDLYEKWGKPEKAAELRALKERKVPPGSTR